MDAIERRTIYLTRAGFDDLSKELEQLRTVALPQARVRIRRTEEFDDAASEAARCDHAFIEGRIAELQRTLAGARIITVRVPATLVPAQAGR